VIVKELLTTGQMIDRLQVGEIAEGVGKGFYSGYQVKKTEYGEIVPVEVKGLENSNFLSLGSACMKTEWIILDKIVTFQEAIEELMEGKKIRRLNDNAWYTKFSVIEITLDNFYKEFLTCDQWVVEE